MDYLIKQNGDFFELDEELEFYQARVRELIEQKGGKLHGYALHPKEVLILASLENVGDFMRALNSSFARFRKNLRAHKALKKYAHKELNAPEFAAAMAIIKHHNGVLFGDLAPEDELNLFAKKKILKFEKREKRMNITQLDSKLHRHLKYHEQLVLPSIAPSVMINEACSAEYFYPLVFTNSSTPQFVALLGRDKNVMLSEQTYLPSSVANYPFFWVSLGEGKETLCIDQDAPQLAGDGIALFNEDGSESEFFAAALEKLKRFRHNQLLHERFLQEIIAADILINKELSVTIDGSKKVLIKGFSVVDKRKLDALSDAVLADWARRGHLELISAHLRSLRHLNTLANRIIENED